MKSKIFISILLCLFATSMQAQDVAEWLQTARTTFENGEYRTVLTNVAKIEDAVGSATKPATAYLRIMSHYRLREYEKCVSAANAYLGAQPAQDETLTEIRTALADAKEQVQLAEEKQRKQAAFAQEAAAEWEKIKTSDSKSALQTFADKYAGTAQEKLARQRYGELVKQDTEAQKAKERIIKVNALLEKYGMVFVEGGDYKISKKETVAVKSFYIGKYEVTRDLYKEVIGKDVHYLCPPSRTAPDWVKNIFERMDIPALIKGSRGSESFIGDFITALNQLTGKKYRLPTEMEWEYAASGGNRSKGYKYSGGNNPKNVAWYKKNSGYDWHDDETLNSGNTPSIRPIGKKSPNELGIYDMSGNFWELCQGGVYKGGDYSSDKEELLIKYSTTHEDYCGAGVRLVLDAE